MAVVPCIVLIGDLTMGGTRPASELAAINPTWTASQSDGYIWNYATSSWQRLEPGVNTSGNDTPHTYWGVEARLRKLLTTEYAPGKNVYFLKKAVDRSQLSLDTDYYSTWSEKGSGSLLSDLISDLSTAQSALVGDTLKVEAIVVSIQTYDSTGVSWRSYAEMMRSLVDNLRSKITVSLGTIRNDGGPCPIVLIEPNYGYQGPDTEKLFRLCHTRMQLQQLASEANRVAVVRCHQLAYVSEFPSATSIVTLADRVVAAMRAPTAKVDVSSPDARINLWIGDDTIEGHAPNGSLPSHLQSALTGAFIWSPFKGTFQTLQVGVNNVNSSSSTDNLLGAGTYHGPEPYVADFFRTSLGSSYTIKGSFVGALGAANTRTLDAGGPPHNDPLLLTWSPGARGQLFDLAVRGWLRSGIDWIRNTSKKPKLDLVVISIGSNDLQAYCTPEAVPAAVLDLIQSTIRFAAEENISTTATKFVVLIPSSSLTPGAALDAMRSKLAEMSEDEDVPAAFVDLGSFSALPGSISLDAAGNAALGQAIIDAYRAAPILTAAVAPLFVSSKDELRKALRMSQIAPDSDALKMIDAAIQTASVMFFRQLGADRISVLRSIPYPNTPYTDLEYLRVLAAQTEIKAVRAQLLRTIPLMLMDGSIATGSWQQEAGFREGNNVLLLRDELKRLEAEIASGMDQLSAMQLSPGGGVSISIVAPDSAISPGQTIQSTVF